jgi:hypothetical protein
MAGIKDLLTGKLPLPNKEEMEAFFGKIRDYVNFSVNAMRSIGANQQVMNERLKRIENMLCHMNGVQSTVALDDKPMEMVEHEREQA